MKYIAAVALASIGYLAFDHRVQEWGMAHPWYCALTFVAPTYAYGFWRMFLRVASFYVRSPDSTQTEPDLQDVMGGFFIGLVWPIAYVCYVLYKGLSRLVTHCVIDYVNKPVVDYAKKTVDKNS